VLATVVFVTYFSLKTCKRVHRENMRCENSLGIASESFGTLIALLCGVRSSGLRDMGS
jgi:hypothetical protein